MHLKKIKSLSLLVTSIITLLTISCAAQPSEEQALQSLRQMTSGGKLPAESVVADIESRFANRKAGALAKLLRARIRMEANDPAGAAAILKTDVFKQRTKLADHAMWLRGKALNAAGSHAEAMSVLTELVRDHPDSIRLRDAKLLWADSAIAAGRAVEVPPMLVELQDAKDASGAFFTRVSLLIARAYEAQGSKDEANSNYFLAYVWANDKEKAEIKSKIESLGYTLVTHSNPINQDYQKLLRLADLYFSAREFGKAAVAYNDLTVKFPRGINGESRLRYVKSLINSGSLAEAQRILPSIEVPDLREEAYRDLALAYAKTKQWALLRSTVDAMKAAFPNGKLVAKTMIDAGIAARDGKNRTDESYYFNSAFVGYPNAPEVGLAQFEAAWFQHEQGNFTLSSQMFIEHLAKYADKDNTNRGKAGYWAARDSERTGKTDDACNLYDSVVYRYNANWYGYLAAQRLSAMKSQGRCGGADGRGIYQLPTTHSPLSKAIANLRLVTVVPETAGEKELERAAKSDDLSTIGLFDWSMEELTEAKKTAGNSPKINLALARHYRWKGDNTNALIIMMKSYPDYAQMFPEEMDRETWAFFYPLINWQEIKYWAGERRLDPYQVAGLIRQESVFTPAARSPANAHGLMQLLVPTAQSVARKYVTKTSSITATSLYHPPLNIELGTAYMRDQLDKFGRIEYMAVAYNAGPGRVPQWRATLPAEIDEFVEKIPFKETKGYVQGIIRNTAQYRRLYDENGNFKPNVGARPLRSEIESKPRDQFLAENPEAMIDED